MTSDDALVRFASAIEKLADAISHQSQRLEPRVRDVEMAQAKLIGFGIAAQFLGGVPVTVAIKIWGH